MQRGIYFLIALLIGFSVHEYAHALIAYKCGDNTAKLEGRLTLNPVSHLDPVGAVFLVFMAFAGFGLAWGKPVPVNFNNLKNPRRDEMLVSVAGITANLIIACIAGILYRLFGHSLPNSAIAFTVILVSVNVSLAVFNLIPLYPLDGSRILMGFMSYNASRNYQIFMQKYSLIIFIAFLGFLDSPLKAIIIGPMEILVRLFIGVY